MEVLSLKPSHLGMRAPSRRKGRGETPHILHGISSPGWRRMWRQSSCDEGRAHSAHPAPCTACSHPTLLLTKQVGELRTSALIPPSCLCSATALITQCCYHCTTFPPAVTQQKPPRRRPRMMHRVLIFQNPTGTNMQLYSSVMQHRIGGWGGAGVLTPASGEHFPAE